MLTTGNCRSLLLRRPLILQSSLTRGSTWIPIRRTTTGTIVLANASTPKSSALRRFFLGSSARRWRVDDVAALFSWVGMGSLLFVVAGTTTAVSLVLVTANSTTARGYLADAVAAHLSAVSGYEVAFDSAVIPNWKDGTIQLVNVRIRCDKDSWRARVREDRKKSGFLAANSAIPVDSRNLQVPNEGIDVSDVDVNWTYVDFTVNTVDVSLSLWRYWQGLGLIKGCKLTGVRGVADRSHIYWPEDWKPFLRTPTLSDFSIDEFVVEDLLITIKNPGNFRPFNVSVYSARLPLLRQQWLLYDIMCADSIVGAYDNCLFSVHKTKQPQIPDSSLDSGAAEMSHLKINGLPIQHFNNGVTGPFGWITSGTIDIDVHFLFPQHQDDQLFDQIRQEFDQFKYIAMDRLESILDRYDKQNNGTNPEYTWFTNDDGLVTGFVGDNANNPMHALRTFLTRPKKIRNERTGEEYIESDEEDEDKRLIETYEPRRYPSRYGLHQNTDIQQKFEGNFKIPLADAAIEGKTSGAGGLPQYLFMHWGICLNDLRASVPLSTPHISYMSNALIRPVVGYMNSHRLRIPLTFELRPKLSNFDGSWDFYSSGLVDLASEEIGRALTLLVLDERERIRHLKRIGLWSVQNATRSLIELLDFIRGDLNLRAYL